MGSRLRKRELGRRAVCKKGGRPILFGEKGGRKGPVDIELRVIPPDRGFRLGVVHVRAFIVEEGGRTQDDEAVGESGGHVELPLVFSGEFDANPRSKGGRIETYVDGHVVHAPFQDTHELALRVRVLKVESSENAVLGAGQVVLHKRGLDAREGAEALGVPQFEEKAAVVAVDGRLDEEEIGERQ